ncbi:Holliday junction branch migration protein RuvA [Roseomonas marmotae]|uniref:Holliday junction branch migration complex subunit RuvA n=1 Tax=Roseomonas marmotae TaxID=2768161 RepID=A0ABS3KHS7_9PROT|nr:Holliday junction branch migration protein RuvA [Roseomonas marmotae]MBO1077014.1 Holliday junction branch migration protein RuvA [Roseomonas marmotae]QTI78412.1 Holliday junction branch migration protein RuvA [Roseomonas marmotae]
MIGKLTGKLDSAFEGGCIFDVNGVGYLVACSSRALSALPPPPAVSSLLIETSVREDAITLYGFADAAERDWFRMLTGIQSVGPKVALSLLSALSPADMARAILAGDKGALTRAAGVGPKLAVRLISELQGKVGGMPIGPAFAPNASALPLPPSSVVSETVSVLLNLGWRRPEAQAVVARVAERLGEGVALELLIRESLKELAPR